MADIQIREITGTGIVPLTFRLRYAVWRDEAELTPNVRAQELITDEHDEHARHWAAFDDGEIVASARMCIHKAQDDTPDAFIFCREQIPAPVGTLNRLVVGRNWRNQGIAARFDACRIQAARNGNAKCLLVSVSGRRIAALQNCGFKLTECWGTSPFVPPFKLRGMILIL